MPYSLPSSPLCAVRPHLQLFMVILASCTSASASVQLRVQGLPNAVPDLIRPMKVASHDAPADVLNISLGDPVGLSITLENLAELPSDPTPVSLQPVQMPAIAVILHPDGSQSLSRMDDLRRRGGPIPIRPLEPGEIVHNDL